MHDIDRTFKTKYFGNIKWLLKLIINIVFIIDYAYFYTHLEDDPLRFARVLRPSTINVH